MSGKTVRTRAYGVGFARVAISLSAGIALLLAGRGLGYAQTTGFAHTTQNAPIPAASAASLFRPIGSPSGVDRFRTEGSTRASLAVDPRRRTDAGFAVESSRPPRNAGQIRQTAWMQSDTRPLSAPQLPSGGFDFPPSTAPPSTAPPSTAPPSTAPLANSPSGGLGGEGGVGSGGAGSGGIGGSSTVPRTLPYHSGNDLTPIPQPQIGQSGYATMDNCALVSAPSTYVAAAGFGCGAPMTYGGPATYAPSQTYVAPPAQVAAPVVLPPAGATVIGGPPVVGETGRAYHLPPLVSFGQEQNPVQVGQGLWGQPVAFVPGQGVRNFIRYWFP